MKPGHRRSSVYSSASNKLTFVFRNGYFKPLEGGFSGENCGLSRVRKNDRFVEPDVIRPGTEGS
jgi:hypothetical protein